MFRQAGYYWMRKGCSTRSSRSNRRTAVFFVGNSRSRPHRENLSYDGPRREISSYDGLRREACRTTVPVVIDLTQRSIASGMGTASRIEASGESRLPSGGWVDRER